MNETIKNSTDIDSSNYICSSNIIDSSRNIDSSRDICSSRIIDSSRNIGSSNIIDSSRDICSSCIIDSSRDICSSRNICSSSYVIFCYNIKLKEFYAFNQQVTEERFCEIKNYWNKIKGDFKLELKDNEWKDEWQKLPNEVWQKLSELPEFDKYVVEKIVGFELNLNEPEELTMEQICKELGRDIKIKK